MPYLGIDIGDGEIEYYKRNDEYFDENERCHDCGIVNKKGNIHHGHCDMERCPKCGGQLLDCEHSNAVPLEDVELDEVLDFVKVEHPKS
jgi:rRNA maturation endonuclease Nob1